ncbi:FEKKY domain-containing protein [Flavobacterium poyangense]|uniref:FEKKY domain-containing protein n=1 Tax=Flavobacterium poyangense TaxID=2204302 RepID=UPI00142342AF|nr:hypothetical protein [Flavobacterium sp. JXAS1]
MKGITFLALIFLLGCKSEENSLFSEYRNQAFRDVEADSVKTFTYGLPFIYPDSVKAKKQLLNKKKIDSIYKRYGLYKKNLGCTIGDRELDKATKEYHRITDSYLDKRNGAGWKEKLSKEIDFVNEN